VPQRFANKTGLGFWLIVGCIACGNSDTGFKVAFDPSPRSFTDGSAASWLSFPFPADHRRDDLGHVDLGDFPNPEGRSLIDLYTEHANEVLDGFGTNSPVYFYFPEGIDSSTLPKDALSSLNDDSPLHLVDLTPNSPTYGEHVPLRWEYFLVEGHYIAPKTLAVAPAWGFPLRENTTYGLWLTNALTDANGQELGTPPFLTHLLDEGGHSDGIDPERAGEMESQYTALTAYLKDRHIDRDDIVAATVFTTQSITSELKAIYTHIHDILAAPEMTQDPWQPGTNATSYTTHVASVDSQGTNVTYYSFEGRYLAPNFQSGSPPYASSGGQFTWQEQSPQIDHYETLRFVLTLPSTPPKTGSCYPLVQYSHGTTGSAKGFVSSTAHRLAARGMAGISIDQPLHGQRWSGSSDANNVALYSFNFLNPGSARSLFRQAAADQFSLTRLIKSGLSVPAAHSPSGQDICFTTDRLSYFGHSQGGLTGSLAAAFEKDIDTWVLSGAGGGLSVTLVERSDEFIDPQALMKQFLGSAEGETFTENHPVVGLLQMIVDITDPINYAPYWHHQQDHRPAAHVFLTSGENDAATPHATASALAISSRTPIVTPIIVDVPNFALAGLSTMDAPLSLNTPQATTAGFMQWTGSAADHFVIFNLPEAIHASMHFLESAHFENSPTLQRDPLTSAR
jgi:hypothetical protein